MFAADNTGCDVSPRHCALNLEAKFQAEIDAAQETITRAQRGLDYWKAVGIELEKLAKAAA